MNLKFDNMLFIFIFLLAGLTLAVYTFYFGAPTTPPAPQPECKNGDSANCSVDSCQGTKICVDGTWSMCRLNMTCIPGNKKLCVIDLCAKAYQVCDQCGNYGPCMPLNN